MRQLSNTLRRLTKAGIILVGLAFIVFGVIGVHQADAFTPTKGVIKSIELIHQATDSNDNDVYEVMVEYTVDGVTYTSDLGNKQNDYTVGKEIDIIYNPEHPESITQPGKLVPIISIVVGAVVAIGALIFLLRDIFDR